MQKKKRNQDKICYYLLTILIIINKKTILINFDNICLYGNKLYQALHLANPNKRSLWKKC